MVRCVSPVELVTGRPAPWARDGCCWESEAIAALDESHLAAVSNDAADRIDFAARLAAYLRLMPETDVVSFAGEGIDSLEAFCEQLERQIPGERLVRDINRPGGVASLLRSDGSRGFLRPAKRRFYLWHDAHELIRTDADLFGRLAEVMLGVAAESEYSSDELLMIHRVVFLGDSTLAAYHDDERGQLRAWRPHRWGDPFWGAISGVDRPAVGLKHLDELAAELAVA